jgi:hypothetical protein
MTRSRHAHFLAAAAAALLPTAGWAQAGPAAETAASTAAAAPPVPGAPPVGPNDPWLWGDVAELRGLDKVTAVTRDFLAPVGEDVQFLALTISVRRCAKRPPERTPEVIVGMEIHDRQTDGAGEAAAAARVFSGWMFGSSPALNPLEHSVYDVWVLDCINSRAPVEEPEVVAEEAPRTLATSTPLPGEVFD